MNYGFAAAALGALHVYETKQRGSGRTTAMIGQLRPFDIVVAPNRDYARQLQNRISEKVPNVRVIVIAPASHDIKGQLIDARRAHRGAVHFDHEFVRLHTEHHLRGAAEWLRELQRDFSPPDRAAEADAPATPAADNLNKRANHG